MTVLFSGGCKNGKSMLAQRTAKTLAGGGKLWYVATMIPHDEEDHARIHRHLREREGWGFETLELGQNIETCAQLTGGEGTYLLDSVTALLANEMFGSDGTVDLEATERTLAGLLHFLDTVEHAVLVSDGIYADARRYDAYTESYRRGLAMIDRALAKRCNAVVEVCAGVPYLHKGELPV